MAPALLGSAPSGLAGLLVQLFGELVRSGSRDVTGLLDRYLLTTIDTARPGSHPLTSDPTLVLLNHGVCKAADALLVLVVVALALRGVLDRSVVSRLDLRSALPRVLVAVVLMHASLTLAQMAIDLNNALSAFFSGLGGGATLWSHPLSAAALGSSSLAGDLFRVLVVLALVVVVALLGFLYVARMAVLEVLLVAAPLAALALILPATRGLALMWARLFATVLFMQAGQLLVLTAAAATGLAAGSGLAADVYALAAIWVTLKVPAFLAHAFSPHGSPAALIREAALQTRRLPVPSTARGL
jgi:hypothetical protein